MDIDALLKRMCNVRGDGIVRIGVPEALTCFFGIARKVNPLADVLELRVIWREGQDSILYPIVADGRLASTSALPERAISGYPGFVVTCTTLPLHMAEQQLLLASAGPVTYGNHPAAMKLVDKETSLMRYHLSGTEWSVIRFEADLDIATKVGSLNEMFPIISPKAGEPTFYDEREFFEYWLPAWRNFRSQMNSLTIHCEDRRVRFKSVTIEDSVPHQIVVDVDDELNHVYRLDYSIKLHWNGIYPGSAVRDLVIGSRWRVPYQENGSEVTLTALDNRGCILHRLEKHSLSDDRKVHERERLHQLVELAHQRGESDQIEFKSWQIFQKDPKDRKKTICKEVIAFANSRGGCLIIGLSDETLEPDGPPLGDAMRFGSTDLDEITTHQRAIHRWIQESIRPSVECSVSSVFYRGNAVLVIEVQPSSVMLHSTGEGIFYVREGATSRPPGREELISMVRKVLTRESASDEQAESS